MKKIIAIVMAIVLISSAYLLINKAIVSGYIILPSDIQNEDMVIGYIEQTMEYKDFASMSSRKPELEKIFLCNEDNYNSKPCSDMNIADKIDRFGWEETYYWCLKFKGVDEADNRNIFLEFLARGDDGVLVDVHLSKF